MGSARPSGGSQRRFICLHGHFYQPPRQNPWLGAMEREPEAYPFHDWNERIDFECYRANAYSRVNAPGGKVARIVNNYELMSFDFGPTLLSWMESHAPGTYGRVVEGDRKSLRARAGHGNAIGHLYNHVIMPLANRRDKETQVRWGIADFKRRFGRLPEGMWLAETAADVETLEVLAEAGIKFTILSPRQARRWRECGEEQWHSVAEHPIAVTRPYKVCLSEGRELAIFFYDAGIVQEIAFGGLLADGDRWLRRIMEVLGGGYPWPPILTIATDGETFGHHHKFADMAVSYLLTSVAEKGLAEPTNLGAYLDWFPPSAEVEIVEPGSWSCAHGVERWRSDCGCSAGTAGWNQQWRKPLREGLNFLGGELDRLYEEVASRLLADPWAARDRYVELFSVREKDSINGFLEQEQRRELSRSEQVEALSALEMERNAQLMFTSCGWFFDDLAGHETGLVLRYAARAIELARKLGKDPYDGFVAILERARSNRAEMGNGRDIYQLRLSQSAVGMERVAAHCGLAGLLCLDSFAGVVYCYEVKVLHSERLELEGSTVVLQQLEVESLHTLESQSYLVAAARLAESGLRCAVLKCGCKPPPFGQVKKALEESMLSRKPQQVEIQLNRLFEDQFSGLDALLPDLRRSVLCCATDKELKWVEGMCERLAIGRSLGRNEIEELGRSRREAIRGFLTLELGRRLKKEARRASLEGGFGGLVKVARQAREFGVALDSRDAQEALEIAARMLECNRGSQPVELLCQLLEELVEVVQLAGAGGWVWELQNCYWALLQRSASGKYRGQSLPHQLVEVLGSLAQRLDFDTCVLSML